MAVPIDQIQDRLNSAANAVASDREMFTLQKNVLIIVVMDLHAPMTARDPVLDLLQAAAALEPAYPEELRQDLREPVLRLPDDHAPSSENWPLEMCRGRIVANHSRDDFKVRVFSS